MSEENSTALAIQEPRQLSVGGAFDNLNAFESAQRIAGALAKSDFVPAAYKNSVANCLVALEISQRARSSVLAVMQGLNVIHGKPSWSGKYVIGAINASGFFSKRLQFKLTGEGDKRQCVAWTKNLDGDLIEGPAVSIAMAKAEGWFQKSGSKWQTMPELMLQYRSASFFGSLHCPDVLMGMHTEEELRDVTPVSEQPAATAPDAVAALNAKLKKAKKAAPTVIDAEVIETPTTAIVVPEGSGSTGIAEAAATPADKIQPEPIGKTPAPAGDEFF